MLWLIAIACIICRHSVRQIIILRPVQCGSVPDSGSIFYHATVSACGLR